MKGHGDQTHGKWPNLMNYEGAQGPDRLFQSIKENYIMGEELQYANNGTYELNISKKESCTFSLGYST